MERHVTGTFSIEVYLVLPTEYLEDDHNPPDGKIGIPDDQTTQLLIGFSFNEFIAQMYRNQYHFFDLTVLQLIVDIPLSAFYKETTKDKLQNLPPRKQMDLIRSILSASRHYEYSEVVVEWLNKHQMVKDLIHYHRDVEKLKPEHEIIQEPLYQTTKSFVCYTIVQSEFYSEWEQQYYNVHDDIIEELIPYIKNILKLSLYIKDEMLRTFLQFFEEEILFWFILENKYPVCNVDEYHEKEFTELWEKCTTIPFDKVATISIYDLLNESYWTYYLMCVNSIGNTDSQIDWVFW